MFRDKNIMHDEIEIDPLILEELLREEDLRARFERFLETTAKDFIDKKIKQYAGEAEAAAAEIKKKALGGGYEKEIKAHLNATKGTKKVIKDTAVSILVAKMAKLFGLEPSSVLITAVRQGLGEITLEDLENLENRDGKTCTLIVDKLLDVLLETLAAVILETITSLTKHVAGDRAKAATGMVLPRAAFAIDAFGPLIAGLGKQQIINMIRETPYIQEKKKSFTKAICGIDVGFTSTVNKVTNYISGKAASLTAAPETKTKKKKTARQRATRHKAKKKKTAWQRAQERARQKGKKKKTAWQRAQEEVD